MILKFRAWDEKNEIITTDFTVGVENGILTFFSNDAEMRILKPLKCTNILDKNGKEIYEGDIVKGNAKDNFIVVPMLGGLSIHNINNLGQKHNELISMPTNDAQTASWLEECEIIGNIHENPELLK